MAIWSSSDAIRGGTQHPDNRPFAESRRHGTSRVPSQYGSPVILRPQTRVATCSPKTTYSSPHPVARDSQDGFLTIPSAISLHTVGLDDGNWEVDLFDRFLISAVVAPGSPTTKRRNYLFVQENVMAKKASSGGTRIVPLGDRVVLKRAEAESTTAGGIVLPDSAQGKPQQGEVVAIGDGHVNDKGERVPLTVKEGDKVIFSSYAGEEIGLCDDYYLLLRESDILASL